MIIYSVTIALESGLENDWVSWMQSHHIPDVMATGYFLKYNLHRLLEPASEEGSVTYNVQYHCQDLSTLREYQENAAPALQADHTQRYKDRFVAFRTILEVV
ncbi:MAG: DUF4286 family protein [Bacteroidia bacterium]|nr:DUF4286 family protein [Bacteroidia bacterium]